MKYTFTIFLVFYFLITNTHAQNHDHFWMLGCGFAVSPDDDFGITTLDFNQPNDPYIERSSEFSFCFDATDVSMCNEEAELLFYTNGVHIENRLSDTLENGDSITGLYNFGNTLPQGALALPYPERPDQYALFHDEWVWDAELSIVSFETEYSIIDMSENNGLGKVVLKKENIISDTLEDGKLMAVRHANGRDWWILKRTAFTNKYYKILLTPEGVSVVDTQQTGEPFRTGLGQGVFSPDGLYYAHIDLVSSDGGGMFIDIYGFDRCTGELSLIEIINYDESAGAAGAAFSPNSRYLYISSHTKFYQHDLWADDIAASRETVAVYDDFVNPLPVRFYLCQLAPNGKIYVSATNSVFNLHVIHFPDKKGTACQMEQHGIDLPTYNAVSMPNFPNYRLGPLDGSPCDTLGLDNIPVAKFRYDQDTLDYLTVEFTDLSYYEPAEWSWDFGDGTTSNDTSLVHAFPASGVYEVCLTVSNQYGQHTYCQTLNLGTVSASREVPQASVSLFPNPCRERVNIAIGGYLPRDAWAVFHDATGRPVRREKIVAGWNGVDMGGLPAGVYFYGIWENGVRLSGGKVVRLE